MLLDEYDVCNRMGPEHGGVHCEDELEDVADALTLPESLSWTTKILLSDPIHEVCCVSLPFTALESKLQSFSVWPGHQFENRSLNTFLQSFLQRLKQIQQIFRMKGKVTVVISFKTSFPFLDFRIY